MYYSGARIFLFSFLVSLFTSIVVCLLFIFVLPLTRIGADRVVPDLVGSNQEQARLIAESRDLFLVVGGEEENEEVVPGMVSRQTPMPGSVVRSKAPVTVFMSKGSSHVTMPDLRNQSLSEATVRLTELGLNIGEVTSEESGAIEKDRIISTNPAAGARLGRGEKIAVLLSLGPKNVEVPRVTGRALSAAKRLIEENGLAVGNIRYEVSTEINVGIVMRQTPAAGQQAAKGSVIDLVVATVLE
ncbi:PASTA domain-containing protein [candidate division WOR-3 bacterium]|nr:PASTA domain-containing protein [candidate division WOR-3 bacterium]